MAAFKTTTAAALALTIALSSHAAAETAADFLRAFDGNWQGTGQSRTNYGSPYVPAECWIDLDWTLQGLRSNGECSGARRTFQAGGMVQADGADLAGTFLSPYFASMVWSSPRVEGGNLVVYSALAAGEVVEARIEVTPPRSDGGPRFIEMRTQVRVDGQFQDVAQIRLVEVGQ